MKNCPKCGSNWEQIQSPIADYEKCTGCGGLWLDHYEVVPLSPIADSIDDGDNAIGKQNNSIDRISCPVCPNNPLIRMVDAKQPHIWYEKCHNCGGMYFDAGEFSDLATFDLSDFFKKLRTKERT